MHFASIKTWHATDNDADAVMAMQPPANAAQDRASRRNA